MAYSTHTFARLEVSEAVFKEIWDKLKAAGYQEQLHTSKIDGEELIDMHGLALVVPKPKPARKRKPLKISRSAFLKP